MNIYLIHTHIHTHMTGSHYGAQEGLGLMILLSQHINKVLGLKPSSITCGL